MSTNERFNALWRAKPMEYAMDRRDAAGRRVNIHYFDCADDEEALVVAKELLPLHGLVEIRRETALVATLAYSDHTTPPR